MAGTLEKRGENKWRLVVSNGRRKDGTQNLIREPFEGTEREARIALARLVTQVRSGKAHGATKYKLASFVEIWFRDYAREPNLAPKTLARYTEMLNSRILPALGHMKIEKIRPLHLMEFYTNLQEKGIRQDGKHYALPALAELLANYTTNKAKGTAAGVSANAIRDILQGKPTAKARTISKALNIELDILFRPKEEPRTLSDQTIKHHHRLLSAIFNYAVQLQIIADNPAARVPAPKVKKKRVGCYDESQTAALLKALDAEPEDNYKFKVLVVLAIASGLRRGELMGLEWKDVDFEDNTIHVRQTSQYVKGKGTITKGPKNESSERLVSVPTSVMALLKNYKAYQNEQRLKVGDKWQGSERLFATWDGHAMHPDTISNWFPEFLRRHNLPHLPFHGLRHTAATLLISQGVHAKTISSRLGHSNISTTMDIYSHHLKSADQSAAEKLDGLFSQNVAMPATV